MTDIMHAEHEAQFVADDFFKAQTPSSRVKATLVSEYFPQYCRIISKNVAQPEIYYMDLFSGPGKYQDGNHSTPLLLANLCFKDQTLRNTVRLIFNDLHQIDTLQANFYQHFSQDAFHHRPVFRNFDMEEDGPVLKHLRKQPVPKVNNLHPTVLFFDPYGYKPVDTLILANFLRHWGNELFLFVNIKRVTAALDNPKFLDNMRRMFPTTFEEVQRQKVLLRHPHQRTSLIMRKLIVEFKKAVGGVLYDAAFKFMEEDSQGTSHFILHFTKHPRGYELAKTIFREYDNFGSELDEDGYYTFDAKALYKGPDLFASLNSTDVNVIRLADELSKKYAGKTVAARTLFDMHHTGNKYSARHYREALRKLAEDEKLTATFTDADKVNHREHVLLTETCILQFP